MSKIKNEDHLEEFKLIGLSGDQVVYTWSPDFGQSTSKYIKDMIYCKQFIHPRNDMFAEKHNQLLKRWKRGEVNDWEDEGNWIDFSKIGNAIFGSDQHYDLYEIDTAVDDYFASYIHVQDPSETKFGTTFMMDTDYAHDSKSIFLFDRAIKPTELKLVSEVSSRIFNNKIHITERPV